MDFTHNSSAAPQRNLLDYLRSQATEGWDIQLRPEEADDGDDQPENMIVVHWHGWSPYQPTCSVVTLHKDVALDPEDTLLGEDSPFEFAYEGDMWTPQLNVYIVFLDIAEMGDARLIAAEQVLSRPGNHNIPKEHQVIVPLGDDEDWDEFDDEEEDGGEPPITPSV